MAEENQEMNMDDTPHSTPALVRRSSRIRASSSPPSETYPKSLSSDASFHNPSAEDDVLDHELKAPKRALPARKSKLAKNLNHTNGISFDIAKAMRPVGNEERLDWRGWVELESDPAFFNFILREYGLKGVKVEEVLGLDDDMLGFLNKPVHGLIFLFKYREEEEEDEVDLEEPETCPEHVWFANQTTNNACATIALLNIVMNVSNADLSEAMTTFKEKTRGLDPAYRGKRLSCDDFIRNIHNSFARRLDMLNSDLILQNEFEKRQRAKKSSKRRKTTKNRRKKKDEEDPGFHFIAYVPIDGTVWRLDGLQRQPINLGDSGDDWISVARANIYERIVQYEEDGVQFNLLSLCQSPLQTIPTKIAQNLKAILAIEANLNITLPEWKSFVESNVSFDLNELSASLAVPRDIFDGAAIRESSKKILERGESDANFLLEHRQNLINDHEALQSSYHNEVALIERQNEEAESRRQDHTPAVFQATKTITEARILKELVLEMRKNGQMK
ncbi:hypothetical protein G7Y89_g5327 [Cudoniella acicularis]|uniref:Ubiquitin carboxyl-terminal hydrolase n=1 Tax=Cudoniella acicularis TaxID=354080 RepID=A0A8H4W3V9_9HELO|nr:hypothetical protein G7Y89_g5327 [Cudoniella acicularis]